MAGKAEKRKSFPNARGGLEGKKLFETWQMEGEVCAWAGAPLQNQDECGARFNHFG